MNDFAMKNLTGGQLNAIVKKLGGEEGAMAFLRGDLIVSEKIKCREKDGLFYFSTISNGRTPEEWVDRFKQQHNDLSPIGENIIRNSHFTPTNGILTHFVAVRGSFFWKNYEKGEVNNAVVKKYAQKQKWLLPTVEEGCLIRDKFTTEEIKAMELWEFRIMHPSVLCLPHKEPFMMEVGMRFHVAWCEDRDRICLNEPQAAVFVLSREKVY